MMRRFFSLLFLFFSSLLRALDPSIPLLHLPDFFSETKHTAFMKELETACSEVGYFALTGSTVAPHLLEEAYCEVGTFFHLSEEEKMALFAPQTNGMRGFVKVREDADFKEFFTIGLELPDEALCRLQMDKNLWPQKCACLRTTLLTLFQSLRIFQVSLADAFERLLHQSPGFLNGMIHEGDSTLCSLFYPTPPSKACMWAHPHTNINLFTIHPPATASGLEVRNQKGEWIDATVPQGTLLINCGDLLESLSNGHFRSSVHRVVRTDSNEERLSIVYFVHPRPWDCIGPLAPFIAQAGGIQLYAHLTEKELHAERLIDLGLASHELMEFFVLSGAVEKLRAVGRLSAHVEEVLRAAGFAV